MASEFEDPRKELLDDLLQWLEWQAVCGGEVWPVEDISIWNQRLPKRRSGQGPGRRTSVRGKPTFLQNTSDINQKQPQKSGFLSRSNTKSESSMGSHNAPLSQSNTARSSKKPKRALASAFTSFLQKRPPSIDFSQLDEKTGLKTIKEHQRQHCNADKPCAIGGGRPANPLLVIEGHAQGLTQSARESLGKIMDNVLNIPRNKMYWLPYPVKGTADASSIQKSRCSLCPHLFKASLECLSPQIVLIMGEDMQQKVSMRDAAGSVKMGVEMDIHTNKWTVPTLWTHHPTDMVGDVRLKKECMIHLKTFKRMLRKVTL